MNCSTQALIDLGAALSLYTAFGENRDSFVDHFDAGVYTDECSDELRQRLEAGAASLSDYKHWEWKYDLDAGEKEWRGLVTVEGKNYLVSEVCEDISKSEYFTTFVSAMNFTLAVRPLLPPLTPLLEYEHDGDNQRHFNPEEFISQLKVDGTYILDLCFRRGNYAFLVMKEGNRITIVHGEDKISSVSMGLGQFTSLFRTLETNPNALRALFKADLYVGCECPLQIDSIDFCAGYVSREGIAEKLRLLADTYFQDRPEYTHIHNLI